MKLFAERRKRVGLIAYPLLLLISAYQRTISPDHGWFRPWYPGGYCKFHPTCSDYAKEVIQTQSALYWLPKIIWRLLRCNPWSSGGSDPVSRTNITLDH